MRPVFFKRHGAAVNNSLAGKAELTWPGNAFDRAMDALRPPGGSAVLVGPRGTGKTQLAAALTMRLSTEKLIDSYLYWPVLRLIDGQRDWFRTEHDSGSISPLDNAYTTPLLVLDEISVSTVTEWASARLESLIDQRYGNYLRTILVGNLTLEEIPTTLGDSVASRLQEIAAVVECQWPSFRSPPPSAS